MKTVYFFDFLEDLNTSFPDRNTNKCKILESRNKRRTMTKNIIIMKIHISINNDQNTEYNVQNLVYTSIIKLSMK